MGSRARRRIAAMTPPGSRAPRCGLQQQFGPFLVRMRVILAQGPCLGGGMGSHDAALPRCGGTRTPQHVCLTQLSRAPDDIDADSGRGVYRSAALVHRLRHGMCQQLRHAWRSTTLARSRFQAHALIRFSIARGVATTTPALLEAALASASGAAMSHSGWGGARLVAEPRHLASLMEAYFGGGRGLGSSAAHSTLHGWVAAGAVVRL